MILKLDDLSLLLVFSITRPEPPNASKLLSVGSILLPSSKYDPPPVNLLNSSTSLFEDWFNLVLLTVTLFLLKGTISSGDNAPKLLGFVLAPCITALCPSILDCTWVGSFGNIM